MPCGTRARIRPGETLLVLGAGGGVGSAAVELGKLLGARVYCCSLQRREARCRGALRRGLSDQLSHGDLRQELKKLCGSKGVMSSMIPLAGFVGAGFPLTRMVRRFLVIIGFAADGIPTLPLNLPLLKGAFGYRCFLGASVEQQAGAIPDRHAGSHWMARGG